MKSKEGMSCDELYDSREYRLVFLYEEVGLGFVVSWEKDLCLTVTG